MASDVAWNKAAEMAAICPPAPHAKNAGMGVPWMLVLWAVAVLAQNICCA